MTRFTQLFCELDQTTRTNEKVAAMVRYFRDAPEADAAWALYFLAGGKMQRLVPTRALREWVSGETGYPLWLVEECYEAAGDLAEALALLLPDTGPGTAASLHELVENRLVQMRELPEEARRECLVRTWRELDTRQRLIWNKLITGSFRVGVSRTLVVRALATVAETEPSIMAHRLMGSWRPIPEDYRRLLSSSADPIEVARPYPFFLASPVEGRPESLGSIEDWLAEWKWDGIRAQLIRRQGQVLIWSRGDELVTPAFPEIAESARLVPDGTVLDGEILAWKDEQPLPFGALQRRINRKTIHASLRAEVPVAFIIYDLLEHEGADFRTIPLAERRARLEDLAASIPSGLRLRISPSIPAGSWEELARMQAGSRERGVEGIMLKRLSSPYRVGRQRGDWWKWKIDPHLIDAVLIYAQRGHGRRASLYTDYTFAVWHEGELVPVAKAYSGLTDQEIREVDAFIRQNTIETHGPVRVVKPMLVFELAFEGIQLSTRHKAGIAVRFPRMHRWRRDKKPEEADSLSALRALIPGGEPPRKTGLLLSL
jgi:DNA ligase 1